MKRLFLTICLIPFILILTGCTGFFEKDNTPDPTPLRNYKPEVLPRLLWSKKVGPGSIKHDYLKLSPTVTETSLYTSSTDGTVTSINKLNGYTYWQNNLRDTLTSGPGVGNNIVVVGSQKGDVIALRCKDGWQIWRKNLPGQIIATPAISGNIVIVKTVAGSTFALSTQTGRLLWSYQQQEPNLILRGSSAPLIFDNNVFVGYANGRLVKLNLQDGQLEWEQMIAIAQGAFAIQRMIDIDADPILYDYRIYVATYQGRIASLDWASGNTQWSHDISTYTGMVADNNAVYVSDAQGLIRAFNAGTGELMWRQDNLQYRIISAPVSMNARYLVVGDGEGYLHWLNKMNGHLAGRVSLGSAIYANPIVSNHILYALTNSGYLAAYAVN